jgi:hypothetical protein
MRRRLILACATAGLVVGLGWQVTAFAAPLEGPHGAVIATSSSLTPPGGSLTVTGQHFASDELITLTLFSRGVTLGSTTTNGSGSFSTDISVPSDTAPGGHTIVANGATGDSASTGITVVISFPTPGPSTAGSGSGPLAGAPQTLELSRITLVPGQPTRMTGHGCAPGAEVVVSINGKEVARITANSQGTFSTSLTPPDQGVGEVTMTATCGSKTFAATVSLVTTSKVSAPEGGVAAGGAFVLLGGILVRGQFGSTSSRRRRRRRGASDILETG